MSTTAVLSRAKLEQAHHSGSLPIYATGTLTFTTSSTAQEFYVPFKGDPSPLLMEGFAWLKIEEYTGSPVNTDDVTLEVAPLVKKQDGTWAQSQGSLLTLRGSADFSSTKCHAYSISNLFIAAGTPEEFFGMDGFLIKVSPAAEMTGTFDLTVELR